MISGFTMRREKGGSDKKCCDCRRMYSLQGGTGGCLNTGSTQSFRLPKFWIQEPHPHRRSGGGGLGRYDFAELGIEERNFWGVRVRMGLMKKA